MAAPVYRNSATLRGNAATGALTIPGTVQDGDWGVLVVANNFPMGTPPTPAGWSVVQASTNLGGGKEYLTVFAKQFVAGDPGPSFTWTSGANFTLAAAWYSGANGVGVVGTLAGATSGTVTTAGAVTTASADNLVLTLADHYAGSGGFAASATVAPDATIHASSFGAATFHHSIVIAATTKATAGSTNAQTVTWDAALTASGGLQVALLPLPTPQTWVPTTDSGATITGWTKTPSGAASVAAVLADSDPATYIESGDNPTGLVYQSPTFTLSKPADLTSVKVKVSGYLAAGSTGSRLIQLYQSTTLIKQSTVALTGANTETVVALNSTEAGSITTSAGQWLNLSVKVTDTAS